MERWCKSDAIQLVIEQKKGEGPQHFFFFSFLPGSQWISPTSLTHSERNYHKSVPQCVLVTQVVPVMRQ